MKQVSSCYHSQSSLFLLKLITACHVAEKQEISSSLFLWRMSFMYLQSADSRNSFDAYTFPLEKDHRNNNLVRIAPKTTARAAVNKNESKPSTSVQSDMRIQQRLWYFIESCIFVQCTPF